MITEAPRATRSATPDHATPLRVLVADDDRTNRMILRAMLQNHGCEVIEAKDGVDAVEQFVLHRPDFVLVDIEMPGLSGYEVTRRVKELAGAQFVPVIFVTGTSDDAGLTRCVECGGDDFLLKPPRQAILQAKLDALLRIRRMNDTIRAQNAELQLHHAQVARDQEVAWGLFQRLIGTGNLDAPNIKYLLAPADVFHGDLLLAAWRPNGSQHVLIGDFAGHGLPAATGTLSVAEIFYSMTDRGFQIVEIAREINRRLKNVLPTGLFLAACFVEVDSVQGIVTVLNAGLPDGLLVRPGVGVAAAFRSRHPPLGILSDGDLELSPEVVPMKEDDRLTLFSDGVPEATAPDGTMFGMERVTRTLCREQDPARMFEGLIDAVRNFGGGAPQLDDQTLIEIRADAALQKSRRPLRDTVRRAKPTSRWSTTLEFQASALKQVDIVPLVGRVLSDLQGLDVFKDSLLLVIGELVNNAVDHGILDLESSIKDEENGFETYYARRAERLAKLTAGWVRLKLDHRPTEDGGALRIHVTDSGKGFDYAQYLADEHQRAYRPYGRGIMLAKAACASLAFCSNGNEVEAEFRWRDVCPSEGEPAQERNEERR